MMWIVTVKNIPNTELSALMLQIALKLITLSGAIILTSSTYRAPCFLIPVDNKDENVQKLGGKVTLTVDRTSKNAFTVKMTNGVATKTYAQPNKNPT